jgi:hypothetical protein
MRSILLALVLCILIFGEGLGQGKDGFTWSDKYEDDGHYMLLAETEDGVIALRKYDTRIPERDRDARLELIKYDENLQILHSVELKDLEESSYEDITTVYSKEGIAHIYYQTFKSGSVRVSAQLFDLNDLRKIEIVDLANFKIKSNRNQRITELSQLDIYFPLDVELSQDKSKMVLFYNQEQVGKRKETNHQYTVIDIQNQFNIIHQGEFYSDNRSDKYRLTDINVSNTGALNYLLKSYKDDSNREFINKKPAYTYELHHMVGNDSIDYIYDIKPKGEFIDKLVLGSDDDNVYISGYIRERPMGKITSSYFLALDEIGDKISESREKYRPREIEDMQGKKDTELNENFRVIDLIVGDKVVYVVKQYIRLDRTQLNNNMGFRNNGFGNNGFGNNGFGNLDFDWDFEEVIIEGYSKSTGDMMWVVTNPRRQEENQQFVRSFIRGYIELRDDNLHMFYNESPDNVERIRRREKLKRTDVPGDTTEPMMAKVNSSGEISYRSLRGERRFHVPYSGVLIGAKNFYLIHSRSNFNEYRIGKSSLDILDF